MARFYGSMQGTRGQATRMGSAKSGFDAHIRGWTVGVRVQLRDEEGHDVVYIYETGGSNGHSSERLIAKLTSAKDKIA